MGLLQQLNIINRRLDDIEVRLADPARPALGPEDARIAELVAAGRSVREIATELGLSRSAVHRRMKAIAANGHVCASAS